MDLQNIIHRVTFSLTAFIWVVKVASFVSDLFVQISAL